MFPDNLTRAEARARAGLVRTHRYQVTVDLSGRGVDDPETSFVSTSTIGFEAVSSGELHVDLIAREVRDVSLDGDPLDPAMFADSRLPLTVTPGRHELTVTARMSYSHSGEGLHRFVDPADGKVYLYSQFEPIDARRMFACFDQPDLKAHVALSVVAPEDWTVVSCAAETERWPAGDALSRWVFGETARISPYVVGLAAGHYHVVADHYRRDGRGGDATDPRAEDPGGSVPMRVLCRQSLVPYLDADRIFAVTAAGFAVFEEHFDHPYPFGKYDQVFVPEYNGGAMENVGCVTLRDEYLFRGRATSAAYHQRDITILHELSHMWFGNLVTMVWWDDLWLKESFATWASHFAWGEIVDVAESWAMFSHAEKTWAYRQDQLPSTHPVAADMVDLEAVQLNFDGITYAKGASVLVQLVSFVGQDAFLSALRSYFRRHAYGTTQLADLLAALTEASGRDLRDWSAQWLESAGTNTIRPVVDVDAAGRVSRFVLEQSAPGAWPTLRRHRLMVGSYELNGDDLVRARCDEVEVAGGLTEVPALVGLPRPALFLVNDDDLTYAKVRFDPLSLATAVEHLPRLTDPVSRAVAWGATWDMCRDADLPASHYVLLALRGAAVEHNLDALTALLAQGQRAALDYAAPVRRSEARDRWESGLHDLLMRAEPGSDRQLALARALLAAARTPGTADRLSAWLLGHDVPGGLEIDRPLRWSLVLHLARLGRLDDAAIAVEEAADRTIAGAEQAAAARAAQPRPQAKEAAWQLAVASDRVTNEAHRAVCRAFWQPDQDDVLAPYVDRYLDAARDISAGRGVWAVNSPVLRTTAVRDLFPRPGSPEPFLARLDAWLHELDLADYVRRLIAERRDDVVRAARCQQADLPGGE